MAFFGPADFSPVELHLAAPHKVFWVASIVVLGGALLRSWLQITIDFATKFPRLLTGLYFVGFYAFAYVCIHMAHNLEADSMTNSVVMMLRWSFLMGAIFLILSPLAMMAPLHAADFGHVCHTCVPFLPPGPVRRPCLAWLSCLRRNGAHAGDDYL